MQRIPKGRRMTNTALAAFGQDAKKEYESGKSVRAIAAASGRSYGTVYNALRKAGVRFRPRGGDTRRRAVNSPTLHATGQPRAIERIAMTNDRGRPLSLAEAGVHLITHMPEVDSADARWSARITVEPGKYTTTSPTADQCPTARKHGA